jgi:CRP/FNR family transcriptional regulator, cyclic AMP receptor protein
MDAKRGAAVLLSTGWLKDRPAEFQQALLANCEWRAYAAGETIAHGGDPHGCVFGLAAGVVASTAALGAPDTPPMHIGHPGHWFGYVPVISNRPRTISTAARSPAFLAKITEPALEALVTARPDWWRHLAVLALDYGHITSNIAADLLIRDSTRRCVATLLRIANVRFETAGDAPAEALVSQEELATLANLSRSTSNVILGRLEGSGHIVRRYHAISLNQVAALRAIADAG